MKSCRDCHKLPGCGWCDDGSGTGLGKCMQGGNDGPFPVSENLTDSCSKPNWNFIGCPGNKNLLFIDHSLSVGGAVTSWLVGLTPHGVLLIRSLAGDIVVFLAKTLTLTVPLSTQVHN